MIQPHTCYVLIDLGGTHLRVAVWPTLTAPAEFETQAFVLTHNFSEDFNQLVTLIQQQISGRQVQAIGFAIPGLLNSEKTQLERAHNLPEWVTQPIAGNLAEQFHCPVFLDNDAVAAALGEVYYGGQVGQDFMLTIWGTGVGGAVVRQGQSVQVEKTDYHKYLAAIEDRCGGKAIATKFGKPAAELTDKEWDKVVTDFLTSMKKLGQTLHLPKIIAGGGVAMKQKQRLQRLAAEIFDESITFAVSDLGTAESFGLYGAAALIRRQEKN